MASAPSTTASTLAPPLRSPLSFSSSRRLAAAAALPRAAGALLCRAPARGLALARARVRCRGAVKLVGEGEFEAEVMQSDLPVLVDFVADWCGPCRLVAPVVDWASELKHVEHWSNLSAKTMKPRPENARTNPRRNAAIQPGGHNSKGKKVAKKPKGQVSSAPA